MSTTSSCEELAVRVEELAEQEHLLRIILDKSPAYKAYVGADDLRYRFVNQKYAEDFNRPREEIVGKHIREIIGEANFEFAMGFIDEVRKGKAVSYENVFDVKQGKRWIKVNFTPDVNQRGEVVGIVVLSYDITDFKLAEIRMQKSETLYHDLVETSQDLIWQCDGEGRYIYLNPAWEQTFGYRIEEMLGKKFTDFQSPEYAERDRQEFVRLLNGNSIRGFETVHLGKDGREIHLVFNAKFLTDENGNSAGTRGTAYDVTERKKAENALLKAQKFTETILSATPDVIYIYDIVARKNIYSNDGIQKVLGYSVSEIAEMAEGLIEALMHPDDFPTYIKEVLPRYRMLQDDEILEHRYRMKHRSGQWRWLHSKESVFLRQQDGSPQQIFGIVADITKQKLTEEQIRKSEMEYRSLFNKMLDGCALHEIICDERAIPVDYRFLSVNPAFERLTGLMARDIVGKTVLEVLPGTEKHWIDTYGRVALTGEPVFFENFSADLDKHFEVTAYQPAQNQFACIFQDITSRKKAEEERIALEAQLRQTQKMQAIGTLAGGIAHDFNNILAAILGYAEMARADIPDWNPAKNQINEVVKAGHRAKDLVKQILAFSRNTENHRLPVQIHLLIKEALGFLRATIPTTIEIQHDLDPFCGNILADPTQIHQVLMNLCTNAVHAMEEDGGLLHIGLHAVDLTADDILNRPSLKPGSFVTLSVADSGVGIAPENLERIFDPYFTTKEVGRGSGMGLAVVHGIVKSHEGVITVESRPGNGTTFRLFFPRVAAEVPDRIGKTEYLPEGTEKILVLDDEESIADVTTRRLENLGYQVTAQTSSIEALELFRAKPDGFDLVLSDQTMPGLTGEQFAKKVLAIRPDIPIILCTGYSARIDAEKAESLGISAFILKPVDRRELAETIRHVLDRKGKMQGGGHG